MLIRYGAGHTRVKADIVNLSGPRSGNVFADIDTGCHYCACLLNIGVGLFSVVMDVVVWRVESGVPKILRQLQLF